MDVDVDIKRLHKHSFYSSITNNYSQSPKEAFFGITFSIFSPAGYIVFVIPIVLFNHFQYAKRTNFNMALKSQFLGRPKDTAR
ncbi:hypothetical protein LOS20_06195 [Enterococcus faecium]|nr:hypothetical protein [Enterococcus faecium]